MVKDGKTQIGLITANRGFFPDHLADEGGPLMKRVLEQEGYDVVTLTPEDTDHAAVANPEDAEKCAALFEKNKGTLDGIVLALPNFGEETVQTEAIKLARARGVDVPILVTAYPDDPEKMDIKNRRDSFCGVISATRNLHQAGIPYTVTDSHVVDPKSQEFKNNIYSFGATCRVVGGLRGAKIGAFGARPQAFNTVRYSEQLMDQAGISVATVDLSEMIAKAQKLRDNDGEVKAKYEALKKYVETQGVPAASLRRIAKLGVVYDKMAADYDATALQCWTSLQDNYGVCGCVLMSMLSESGKPAACEVDVGGVVGMLALQLGASHEGLSPSAILDWNNNYGDNPDRMVLFHCSNIPKSFFTSAKMDYQEIIAGSVGKNNTYGTVVGRFTPNPFTFARVDTDDPNGRIVAYVGNGRFLDETEAPLNTFGGYGVAEIAEAQKLLHLIRDGGLFAHHVAANVNPKSELVAKGIAEALDKYMGMAVYHHQPAKGPQ